jgi:uncharacterized protein
LSVYLDASLLVSFFTVDALSENADALLGGLLDDIVVSDFAAVEFASAVARRVRMGRLDDAGAVFADFDAWVERAAGRVEIRTSDVAAAASFIRRLDLNRRAADAIHIAIAGRVGATLATFDVKMADSARALNVVVARA